ncbi:MaoC/PaaZ C-terminal domain-containing protein [Nocardioides pantholopis]|uniref:MaoC/PaaZ C-terminal domain-containing protein n=1 Tax=Nocardioides pantholopis TaxID=2483798 RepID=UPI000F08E819|nr:MaoC/PaaZ C-terminal domain-containing protein [Nocardioides pantholopis]
MVPNLDAVGFVSPRWTRTWTSTDSLLYAVALGAGPDELSLTTENCIGVRQRAVPSYAALIGRTGAAVREAVGPAWDPVRLVYAGQRVVWHRELAPEGAAELESTVVAIADKGSGALVTVDTTATEPGSGEPLFTARRQVFLRGAGGFDPSRSPEPAPEVSDESDETVLRHRLPENQALLYRLCGDRHPLHSDPAFARRAGFDRPILHGLCTYGVTARLLLREVLRGDPGRMTSLEARFRATVWPGDDLELRYRTTGPGSVHFQVRRLGSARPALDAGVLTFKEEAR